MGQLWLRSKTHKVSCRTLRFGNYDSLSLSGWKNSYWFFSFLKRKIKITLKDVSNFATTFISRYSHLKQLLNCNFYFRAIVTDLNLLTGNKWEFLLFFFFEENLFWLMEKQGVALYYALRNSKSYAQRLRCLCQQFIQHRFALGITISKPITNGIISFNKQQQQK